MQTHLDERDSRMLQLHRMNRHALGILVGGVTLLLNTPSHAAGLRDEATGYRAQGYERQQQGDVAGALSFYQKAAALDPSYASPQNDMGVVYEEMGRIGDARTAYEQALTIDPNFLQAHANLAMLYERIGEKEKAIVHWLKRYQMGDSSDPWTNRAEERLAALGVLQQYPGLKGTLYTRRHQVEQELEAHDQSLKEYRATTDPRWRLP